VVVFGPALVACASLTGLSAFAESDAETVDASVDLALDAADIRADDVRADTEAPSDALDRAETRAGDASAPAEGGDAQAEGGEGDAETIDAGDARADAPTDGAPDASLACTASTCPSCGSGCTPCCTATGTCKVVHANGEGQTFYDCAALDTHDQTQAMEACVAFSKNSSQCTQSSNFCSSIIYAICSVAASTCHCWQYTGPNAGTVQSPTTGCSAQCGSASDPAWN
jgi:hypothetical protein